MVVMMMVIGIFETILVITYPSGHRLYQAPTCCSRHQGGDTPTHTSARGVPGKKTRDGAQLGERGAWESIQYH